MSWNKIWKNLKLDQERMKGRTSKKNLEKPESIDYKVKGIDRKVLVKINFSQPIKF